MQSNDGKEVVEVGQKLIDKFMVGFEVGGIKEVFIKEIVEMNEIEEGKNKEQVINSLENIMDINEELGIIEVEVIIELSVIEEMEVRSVVVDID